MLTLSKTCCSTCCTNCGVDYLGVSLCRNYCLSNNNCVTNGAVLTLSKTCLCTCCTNCRIDYLGMTLSRNNLLRYKNYTTCRTVFTFGKTCLCTCRSFCIVNCFDMTELFAVNFSTLGTCLWCFACCIQPIMFTIVCWVFGGSNYGCCVWNVVYIKATNSNKTHGKYCHNKEDNS